MLDKLDADRWHSYLADIVARQSARTTTSLDGVNFRPWRLHPSQVEEWPGLEILPDDAPAEHRQFNIFFRKRETQWDKVVRCTREEFEELMAGGPAGGVSLFWITLDSPRREAAD